MKLTLLFLIFCTFFLLNASAQPCPLITNYTNFGSLTTIDLNSWNGTDQPIVAGCLGYDNQHLVKFTPPSSGKYFMEVRNYTNSPLFPGSSPVHVSVRSTNGTCDLTNYFCIWYDSTFQLYTKYYTIDIPVGGISYDLLFFAEYQYTFGSLEILIQCSPPLGIAINNTTTTQATINFTCNCPATTEIEYWPVGTSQSNATIISSISSPFTLTGLDHYTVYNVNLRTSCGGVLSSNKFLWFRTKYDCNLAPTIACGEYFNYVNTVGGYGLWQNYGCGYTNNNYIEKIYKFTPTTSGIHSILHYGGIGWVAPNVTLYYKEISGTCNETGWICIGNIDQSAPQTFNWGPLTAGTTYLFMVDGHYNGAMQSFKFLRFDCPDVCSPPLINTPNLNNITDNSVTITGCESCSTNLTLEYGLAGFTPGTGSSAGAGGTVISNVTLPYTINNLISGTTYEVFARNNCGTPSGYSTNSDLISFTTLSCTLTVASITASGPTTFCLGGSVTLNANTGTGLTYQWLNNGNNINGATSSSLSANNTGNYSVVVTNSCGSSTSNVIPVLKDSVSVYLFYSGHFPCPNQCNGALFVLDTMTTGIPPFTYIFSGAGTVTTSPGQTSITNLCALDIVSVTVTDANGCTASDTRMVEPVPTQNPTISITPACNLNNGSVTVGNLIWAAWNCDMMRIRDDNYNFITNGSTGVPVSLPAGNYILETYCSSSQLTTGPCPQYFPFIIPGGITPASITASGTTSLCNGNSVTLNANTGTGLIYQWQLNGNNISGANLSFYVASNAGNYAVVVTDSCGSNTSNIISVTVGTAPNASITASGSTSICVGSSVTLSANTGTGLTYQWQLNGNNISGATSSSYTASTAGNYSVVVNNSCGSSTSNNISVLVTSVPNASINASGSTSICAGGSVTLNANSATGLTYQWRLNGNNINGATSASYTAITAGNYTVVVTNICGSSTSNAITVTLSSAPSAAISASGSTSICNGNTVLLSANTGTGLSYQWQLNGNNIFGATSSTYSANTIGDYSVIVSNNCGNSISNIITVTVISAPGSAGAISGPTSFCRHSTQTFSVAPVPGAINYVWTVPPQANIVSGAGTNSIVVSFVTKQGDITVKPANSCGSGPLSVLSVQLLKCANPNSNNPNSTLRTAFNSIIYPNPSQSEFNCLISGEDELVFTLNIYDHALRLVEQIENVNTNNNFTFGNNLASGFYFVEIDSGAEKEIFKVVKIE